ncbi:kelch-like protein 15 [Glandiceps talaboti]
MAMSFQTTSQESRTSPNTVHACELLENLNGLRKDGVLFDMTVRVQNEEFDAHSIVLASSCEYFRSLFTSGMKESVDRHVHLKAENITSRGFKFLLEYMYTGDFPGISMENVYDILDVANHLQYEGAMQRCSHYIVEHFKNEPNDVQNYVAALTTAELYGLIELKSLAMDGMKENFIMISTETEFSEMVSKELLCSLISESDLNVHSEVDVLDAVLSWLNFDLGKRLKYATELLSKVRLILIDPYILNELSKRQNAETIPQFRDMVVQALVQHALPSQQIDAQVRGNSRKVLVSFTDVGGPLFPSVHSQYVDMYSKTWKDINFLRVPNQSMSLSSNDDCIVHGDSFYVSLNKTMIYNYNVAMNQWINLKYCKPKVESWEKLNMIIAGKCLYVSLGTEIQRFNFSTGQWQYMYPVTSYNEDFTTILTLSYIGKSLLVFGRDPSGSLLYGFLNPELNEWITSGVSEELSNQNIVSVKVFNQEVCVVTHCMKTDRLELWIGGVDADMQISWHHDMADMERLVPQRYQDSVIVFKGKVYLILGSYWYDTGARISTEKYGVDLRHYVPDILLRVWERKKSLFCELRLRQSFIKV